VIGCTSLAPVHTVRRNRRRPATAPAAGESMREPLMSHGGGLEKSRLEALADGIFAVALTLLVLDIRLPEDVVYATNDALWRRLASLERHFVIYVISFVVIGMYWINHHIQFHFVTRTNRILIWINLMYLLLVSFLPFATDLIGDHKDLVLPCEIYGATLVLLSFVNYAHVGYLSRHPQFTSPGFTPEVIACIRRRITFFAVVPLVSMSVAFFSTHLALYVYLLLVGAHFLPGQIDREIMESRGAVSE
jgi:uncharacterized membrane protein